MHLAAGADGDEEQQVGAADADARRLSTFDTKFHNMEVGRLLTYLLPLTCA
jgi:hypothetical protein